MTILQKQQIFNMRSRGDSYKRIADALGVSINTIQSYCRRNSLGNGAIATFKAETENRAYCKECGTNIIQQPGRKTKKFCSDACCAAWWKAHPEQLAKKAVYSFVCAKCGTAFTAYGNSNRKYCSHACYVADRFGKEAAS